jgi:hypothetical protein
MSTARHAIRGWATALGAIVQRGYKPAGNLNDQVRRAQPLSHYFYVMTHGYGAMPDYSAQLTPEERWAVAAYIRALQLSQNATEKDVASGAKVEKPEGHRSEPRDCRKDSPDLGTADYGHRGLSAGCRGRYAGMAPGYPIDPKYSFRIRQSLRAKLPNRLKRQRRPRRGIKERETRWHTLLTQRYFPQI